PGGSPETVTVTAPEKLWRITLTRVDPVLPRLRVMVAGVNARENPASGASTTSASVRDAESIPSELAALTIASVRGLRASAEADKVKTPVLPAMLRGDAVTPLGNPLTVTVTGCMKPEGRSRITSTG